MTQVAQVHQEYERGVALRTLKDWPDNPKGHDVDAIVASMTANGAYGVVYAQRSSRRLLAGHGRKAAYRVLGVRAVDVVWLDVDDKTAARIVAADNHTATLGGYDDSALYAYLRTLQADDNLIGSSYDSDDVEAVRRVLEQERPEREPEAARSATASDDDDDEPTLIEPPRKPVSQRGVVYQLGRHRVLCGDSTNADHVKLLMADAVPDMILMDPPYCSGGFQEAGKRAGSVGTRGTEMVANDTLSTRGYQALMRTVLANYPAGIVYSFTDWRMWISLFDVVESSGYGVRNMIVWDKGTPGMGAGWRMQHELVMCGIKVRSPFDPKKAVGNVIPCKRTGNIYHATEKPVDLVARILSVTAKAKIVADPMAGSGTTVLAAERTGRTAYAMELTPHYTDVIRQRYADLKGDATLAPRGQLTPVTRP
jgi:DNA modification methylase